MYFKPRIFISSALNISKIRDSLNTILKESGAEVLMYETNLTPSTKLYSYRSDVAEADFVIFIFNDRYGTPTSTGLSGTHEEWNLVKEINIPSHVYIKRGTSDRKLKKLIQNEIKSKGVTYYYYDSEKNLFSQIQSTIFTIARESFSYRLRHDSLPQIKIKKLAIDHDYQLALKLIRGYEELNEIHSNGILDIVMSTTLYEFFLDWIHGESIWKIYFIDSNIDNLFRKLIHSVNDFVHYQTTNTNSKGNERKIHISSINMRLHVYNLEINPSYNHTEHVNKFRTLNSNYIKFKKATIDKFNRSEFHL